MPQHTPKERKKNKKNKKAPTPAKTTKTPKKGKKGAAFGGKQAVPFGKKDKDKPKKKK